MSSCAVCRSRTVATIRASMTDGPDGESIRRLAELDCSQAPEGAVVLAEVSGKPVAAIGIADGRTVADPDRTTPELIAHLALQRLQVRLIGSIWGI
jgi:hypothetical protein